MFDILLVDDERLICEGLVSMIKRLNISGLRNLDYTTDSLKALEIIKKQKPDIVITDIMMPSLSGLDLIDRSSRDVMFIVLSGYDDFHYVKVAYNLGIVDYLLKPVIIDELGSVIEKANSLLKKKAHSKEVQRSHTSILLQSVLVNKLTSLIYTDENAKLENFETIEEFKAYFPNELFAVALVSVAGLHAYEFERSKDKEKILNELVEHNAANEVVIHGIIESDEPLVLVCNFPRSTSLKRIRDSIGSYMSAHFSEGRFSVSLSETGNGLKDVANCYDQAQKAYRYRIISNINGITEYADIKSVDKQVTPDPKSNLETFQDRIQMYFTAGKVIDISNLIDELFSKDKLKNKSIQNIEYLFHSIVHIMDSARLLHGMRIEPLKILDFQSFNNLSDLRIYLKSMAHRIMSEIKEHDHSRSLSEMAKNYIQQNYNKDIDMTMVANQVSVSYSYFSKLFKEKVGLSFSEYLTKVRMEKALSLLNDPSNKVLDIAETIGYQNPKNFTRAFRKHFGFSPTDYRDNL